MMYVKLHINKETLIVGVCLKELAYLQLVKNKTNIGFKNDFSMTDSGVRHMGFINVPYIFQFYYVKL